LSALSAAAEGDFSARLPVGLGDEMLERVAQKFNDVIERNEEMMREVTRVEQAVRRDGRMTERTYLQGARGGWASILDAVNSLMGGLVQPTTEVARVISAV